MSRIGREPIAVPAGVTITIADGNNVTVKGPLGELKESFAPELTIAQEGATLTVTRPNDEKEMRALHGLTRTLLNNMVVGVTSGYTKKLEIVGVGYRVEKQMIFIWLSPPNCLTSTAPSNSAIAASRTASAVTSESNLTTYVRPPVKSTP